MYDKGDRPCKKGGDRCTERGSGNLKTSLQWKIPFEWDWYEFLTFEERT